MNKKTRKNLILGLMVLLFSLTKITGQEVLTIKGIVMDGQNKQSIPYATVALYSINDSKLLTGTLSNDDGNFELKCQQNKACMLKVSYIGYQAWSKTINQPQAGIIDIAAIYLQPETIEIDEAVVVADRIKAKNSYDKTTFFINKKMQDASHSGMDVLKCIPGVQVDLMQNVRFEGSQNILILVDGKERDKGFLSQLDAKQIDKVEIVNTPGAKYDATISGVLNIILKKTENKGISGNVVLDIPTRKSEMYLFPSVNLNVGLKKVNLYFSYNAEIRYFDLIESNNISYLADEQITSEVSTMQYYRQKNWEQRFNCGFDYFLNDKNQFNFYAFLSAYSNERDGHVTLFENDNNSKNLTWLADREETDMNFPTYYSMYYKHFFNEEGHAISFDINYYNYKRENKILNKNNILEGNNSNDIVNSIRPTQNTYGFKLDYVTPLNEKFKMDAGAKIRLTSMEDHLSEAFNYYENIYSAYGSFTFNQSKMTMNAGLRVEKSTSGITGSFDYNNIAWLPNALINYKLSPKQNLKLSYSRKITRPYLYQLNPSTYVDDPFSLHSGNEQLNPELHNNITLDYSLSLGDHYLSAQLFHHSVSNAINSLMFLNDTNVLENHYNNLGTINFYGIKLTNALKLHRSVSVNTYFRIFGETTEPNSLASNYNIENRQEIAFDLGISAIFTLKYDITATIMAQYRSPEYAIQTKSFNDLLYFISIEKAFKEKFKFGLACAPLFAKEFTYRGLETEGPGFNMHSEGNVQLTNVPFWFKLSYNFSLGKKIKNIERTKEIINNKEHVGM